MEEVEMDTCKNTSSGVGASVSSQNLELHPASINFYTTFLKAYHGIISQQSHVHSLLCIIPSDSLSLVPTSGPGSGERCRTEVLNPGGSSTTNPLLGSLLDSPR